MKKIVIITFALLFICTAGVYAVENTTGEQLLIEPTINKQSIADINLTSVRFCNGGLENLTSSLEIESRPGQVQEICAVFFNNLDTGSNFSIGFTEATRNGDNARTCDDTPDQNAFSKFIRNDFASEIITVNPHKQKQKMYTIGIPKTATGDIIGCLSYTMDSSYSKNTGDVFGILVRKNAQILISVTGDVYNYGWRDDMKYVYKDNKQTILKIIMAILAVRIIITIVQTGKKKKK